MPSEKMSATEAWVRSEAPELLTGPLAKEVSVFIKQDDLNGLAHFLQRQAERYQAAVSKARDISVAERELKEPRGAADQKPSRPRSTEISQDDMDRHIAALEANGRVLADMVAKQKTKIEELEAKVRALKGPKQE